MRLEPSDQLVFALPNRYRADEVWKPSEVSLALDRTFPFENRQYGFPVDDLTGGLGKFEGIEKGGVEINGGNNLVAS